jgi:hypothetical protein
MEADRLATIAIERRGACFAQWADMMIEIDYHPVVTIEVGQIRFFRLDPGCHSVTVKFIYAVTSKFAFSRQSETVVLELSPQTHAKLVCGFRSLTPRDFAHFDHLLNIFIAISLVAYVVPAVIGLFEKFNCRIPDRGQRQLCGYAHRHAEDSFKEAWNDPRSPRGMGLQGGAGRSELPHKVRSFRAVGTNGIEDGRSGSVLGVIRVCRRVARPILMPWSAA